MKQLSLKEVKNIELNILIKFDEICKKNNLHYYLAGGTLLGAIRHKGFIPWDDDIDVCMPRKNYEQLLKLKIDDSRYILKNYQLKNASIPFTKLIDLNTKIDSKYVDNDSDTNLWIDIFPVDGLPENIDELKKIYSKCHFYRTLLQVRDAKLGKGRTFFRTISKYFIKPVSVIYGRMNSVHKIEQIAAQYPYKTSKYVGAITWGLYGVGERMLKSEFEKAVEVEFEGHKFPAFSCWDSYLKGLYGDYMQLPPVEKRKTHDMVAYLLDEDKEQ